MNARQGLFALLFGCATLLVAGSAGAAVVDLKVLLITGGSADFSRSLMTDMMKELGVPYDEFDASSRTLTSADLESGGAGKYNGIILTDAYVYDRFSPEEWTALHNYERTFQVREVVVSGAPRTPSVGAVPDYGMASVAGANPVAGKWNFSSAPNKELFEYVNVANTIPITEWTVKGTPRVLYPQVPTGAGPSVQPLMVDNAAPTQAIISLLRYSDGRRVLLSTVANAWFALHSQILAYEFLNFATKGVFIGARYTHLAAQNDDLFLPDEIWDPATNTTPVDNPAFIYRLSPVEFQNAITQQNAFRSRHPRASTFKLDFAYNGDGAGSPSLDATHQGPDPLTSAIEANANSSIAFRYINHTFQHLNMNLDALPEGADDPVPVTTTALALSEITKNRQFGSWLGLQNNRAVLVSGEHSGLRKQGSPGGSAPSPVAYPWGKSDIFLSQVEKDLVTCMAFDSSQVNQGIEHWVVKTAGTSIPASFDHFDPGLTRYKIAACPRYPANVFYNVTTPDELVDEYNYIFFTLLGGTAGGISAPRNYQEILADEADKGLRHILTYRMWPHFFHQTNLRNYSGGTTLQFDWLDAVVGLYERHLNLPLQNLTYHEVGNRTRHKLNARTLGIRGALNTATNAVSITSSASTGAVAAQIRVTGVTGGTTQLYGGQRIGAFTVNPNGIVNTTVDRQVTSLTY